MTIKELREKRKKAWDTARDFLEAEMNKATSTPVLGKPATPNVTEKIGTASDTYKKAFWNSIRNRNWIDVHDDLHIGTDAEGGYLVPDEFVRL